MVGIGVNCEEEEEKENRKTALGSLLGSPPSEGLLVTVRPPRRSV